MNIFWKKKKNFSDRAPPLPIPNREVKPVSDYWYCVSGRVGRRRSHEINIQDPFVGNDEGFFACGKCDFFDFFFESIRKKSYFCGDKKSIKVFG